MTPAITRPHPRQSHLFERPHRPLGLRAANLAGGALRRVRHRALSLDRDDMIATARRRTGLAEAELALAPAGTYLDGLDVLLGSLECEARLTPAGRYFAREQVITSLSNRLLLSEARRTHPRLDTPEVAPPVVIVGLPRSGTTFLQHLLARDPKWRVLRQWEAAHPAATRSTAADTAAQRATDRGMRVLDYLAPDARILHPVDTLEPTECVTLFSNSFASLELATINQTPSYLQWCLGQTMEDAYAEYVLQLAVLENVERRPRWLLKSPAHLFWLDRLVAVMPDVRIVQVHRDPLEVIGSFCSLSAVLCGIGSDHVDLPEMGARWAPAWAEGLARTDRVRRTLAGECVVDVEHTDLIADPMGQVRRIYDTFGLELSDTALETMSEYAATQRQHGRATHRYTLAQFGLDSAVERERFSRFRVGSGG
jgi:Sulfotransferase family